MITPSDSPSAPELFASVPVQQQGILAGHADLSGAVAGAVADAMARQPDARRVMESPAGFGEFSIVSGSSGGGGEDWPSSVAP